MSVRRIIDIGSTSLLVLTLALIAGAYFRQGALDDALVGAVQRGDLSDVRLLVRRGANIRHRDRVGFTPLFHATHVGETQVVLFLLSRGADPNASTIDGWTPLMNAAVRGDDLEVRALIAAGADVNTRTQAGETALRFARSCRHPSTSRQLRQVGGRL